MYLNGRREQGWDDGECQICGGLTPLLPEGKFDVIYAEAGVRKVSWLLRVSSGVREGQGRC